MPDDAAWSDEKWEALVNRMKKDPLRTYDAWAKDKDGKPQSWEEYMEKKQ